MLVMIPRWQIDNLVGNFWLTHGFKTCLLLNKGPRLLLCFFKICRSGYESKSIFYTFLLTCLTTTSCKYWKWDSKNFFFIILIRWQQFRRKSNRSIPANRFWNVLDSLSFSFMEFEGTSTGTISVRNVPVFYLSLIYFDPKNNITVMVFLLL